MTAREELIERLRKALEAKSHDQGFAVGEYMGERCKVWFVVDGDGEGVCDCYSREIAEAFCALCTEATEEET